MENLQYGYPNKSHDIIIRNHGGNEKQLEREFITAVLIKMFSYSSYQRDTDSFTWYIGIHYCILNTISQIIKSKRWRNSPIVISSGTSKILWISNLSSQVIFLMQFAWWRMLGIINYYILSILVICVYGGWKFDDICWRIR